MADRNKISLFLIEAIGYPDKKDSNLLVSESIRRGYETFCFRGEELYVEDGKVFASAHKANIDSKGELFEAKETSKIELNNSAIVNIRINPPFDSSYLTSMYILDLAQKNGANIFNNPEGVILSPEKFIPSNLTDYTPKTLITSNFDQIVGFWKENEDVIIKPLYEFAGRSIFRLKKNEENYKSILQTLKEKYSEQLIAQEYLPEVKNGDKRIVILDYQFIGCYNRIPPENQLQAAVAQGGSMEKSDLAPEEEIIVEKIIPELKKKGIFICGLDTIGGKLTEINTTCPSYTGLNKLYDIEIEKLYWEKLEKYLK